MRFLITCVVLTCGMVVPGLLAQQPDSKGDEKVSESAKRPKAEKGTRATPFGRVRQDANPQPPPKPEKPSETGLVSAEVKGDVVTFRRKTPFGNQVWTRRRGELNEDEKEILAKQSNAAKSAAPSKAESTAAPKPAAESKPSGEVAAKPE